MPKRKKPYDPSKDVGGDHGTGTAAALADTRLEPVPKDVNGMHRRVREGALERLHKRADGINTRQFNAGVAIRSAFEATQTSPPAIREVYVDSTLDPARPIDVQVDRQSEYARLMKSVPPECKALVVSTCCMNEPVRWRSTGGRQWAKNLASLQVALDLVANDMGMA